MSHWRRHGGVAFLLYDLDAIGGAELQASRLAHELGRQRMPVLVVTTNATRGRAFSLERRGSVRILRVPSWLPFAWWRYALTQDLIELAAGWAIRRYARWARAVLGIPAYPTGIQALRVADALGRSAIAKLASSGEAGELAALERDPGAPELRTLLRRLARVVYLNEEACGDALGAGVEPARLQTIPNGVDLSAFAADLAPASLSEIGFPAESELVVFVGRLGAEKRVPDLLDAFALLAPRRPRARLALVGDGAERGAIESRIRALGLEDRARILGMRRDVPRILRAARVFVLPSGVEGQSNALLEAFAARVPAVASDVPGNRALATHGREALLVPVGDPPALGAAIERVLGDGDLARGLAHAGHERALELSLERAASRWRALVYELPPAGAISERAFFGFVAARAARIARAGIGHGLARTGSHADLWLRRAVTAAVVGAKHLLGRGGNS